MSRRLLIRSIPSGFVPLTRGILYQDLDAECTLRADHSCQESQSLDKDIDECLASTSAVLHFSL